MGYAKGKIRPGRYLVKYGLSNYKIIAKLRSGQQDPVQLKINNVRDITQLCSKLSNYISLDSTTLLNKLSDSLYLHSIGYTKKTFFVYLYQILMKCTGIYHLIIS